MTNPLYNHAYTIYNSTPTYVIDKNSEKYKADIKRLRTGSDREQDQYKKITGKAPTWQGRIVDSLIEGDYTYPIITFAKGFFLAYSMCITRIPFPIALKVVVIVGTFILLFYDVTSMCIIKYKTRDED
jgi:hypothetical protein